MSRTDHHAPWQIRADDPINQRTGLAYWFHSSWSHRTGGCDEYCGWTIAHSSLTAVPGWFTNHVWHDPERTRERDGLRALAREYTTFGDLQDGDFPCWQHRHNGRAMFG